MKAKQIRLLQKEAKEAVRQEIKYKWIVIKSRFFGKTRGDYDPETGLVSFDVKKMAGPPKEFIHGKAYYDPSTKKVTFDWLY